MAGFLNNLSATQVGKGLWRLDQPLLYKSDKLNKIVAVPAGFVCDFESIGRWLTIGYVLFANTANRAGVVHDYLYRRNSEPRVKRVMADAVYREASLAAGNPRWQAYTKWLGVRAGGWGSYHKKSVTWKPEK